MLDSYALEDRRRSNSLETTTEFPASGNQNSAPKKRCHFAFVGSGTPHGSTQDIGCILRQRLLVAAIIAAAGFVISFLRITFGPGENLELAQWNPVALGATSAVMVLSASILASNLRLSVTQLRIVEAILFGTAAAYFGWTQVGMFLHGEILQWAKPEHQLEVARIANFGNILRWFALIVAYGTLVPNTWKRCAVVVGALTAIPIILMTGVCFNCPIMGPHLGESLMDMIVMLGMASAIATFGSYKISELHQEAMEAKKLGQYQLKQLLGRGGMGEVYLGEHTMLRRACAIKLIRADHDGDATSLSRFEREVKAMAKLTHWNTAAVYDYGMSDDGRFYYVMEYLPGMSLQQLVESYGPLPPGRVVYFLRQVCDALLEAHQMGIIHRDIKPSNVLACQRGGLHDVAKLLDFGLVQCAGKMDGDARLTMQGVVLGSPPYMSPEQALGKDQLDPRTDIYSVGGLGYYLLTGRPPFERETPMQILMAHVYDTITPPSEHNPDIPKDLEAVILRCLSKDPHDRFANVEELEQALAECECADDWSRREASKWWQQTSLRPQQQPVAVG